MMNTTEKPGQLIVRKFERLKAKRAVWESHWQEVMDYVMPNKNNVTTRTTPGSKKGITLYDSTAVNANVMLAGAFHGLLTNPASPWFGLTTGDRDLDAADDIRHWLQKCGETIHDTLNNSNFQTEIHEVYLDLGAPGTATLFIEEDDDTDVRFSARHISETFIEENSKGVVDTLYRCFQWDARQCHQEFDPKKDNIPKVIKEAFAKNLDDKFEIIHAIEPREDAARRAGRAYKKGPKGYAWKSCYIHKDSGEIIKESGFEEFPAAVPRASKVAGEDYGRSSGMNALPDIKMVNKMMETVIKGAALTIAPPLQAPSDGITGGKVNMNPLAVNYIDPRVDGEIRPIITDARIDFGYQAVEDVRKRIRSAFYYELLQLQEGPQMTATEVIQRSEEKMRVMGPVLGRMHAELLGPIIDRVFAILYRRKKLPPIPQALSGKKLKVTYLSQIAKAQRTTELQNLTRMVEVAAPFIQGNPGVMDNVDGDKALRFIATTLGVPTEVLKDERAVKKERQAKADLQRQQMQQEQMANTAKAMGDAAPMIQTLHEVNGGGQQ